MVLGCGEVRIWRIGSRLGGRESVLALALLMVLEGGRSRRPVVYTGFGLKVIMVGSGGFGVRCFLWERSRLVSVCWMLATRLKGVMLGRWRWARRIFGVWWFIFWVVELGLESELESGLAGD